MPSKADIKVVQDVMGTLTVRWKANDLVENCVVEGWEIEEGAITQLWVRFCLIGLPPFALLQQIQRQGWETK